MSYIIMNIKINKMEESCSKNYSLFFLFTFILDVFGFSFFRIKLKSLFLFCLDYWEKYNIIYKI